MKPFTVGYIAGLKLKEDKGEFFTLLAGAFSEKDAEEEVLPLSNPNSSIPASEPFRSLALSVIEGDETKAEKLTEKAVQNGAGPLEIAVKGLLAGMNVVSELYNQKKVYVPEMLLAARALQAGIDKTGCTENLLSKKGIVLLHTAEGDLHDIGKNIVKAIVEANGYQVIDLGTSVETNKVLAAIRKHSPIAVLGSSLMTSTRMAFLSTADTLKDNSITVPFIIGGGACDEVFASQKNNLRYAKNPTELVKILDSINRTKREI